MQIKLFQDICDVLKFNAKNKQVLVEMGNQYFNMQVLQKICNKFKIKNTAVNENQVVSTPGDAVVTPETEIGIDQENARAFIFDPGTELSTIVESINAVGSSAADLVAILEALREAGSLRAELIII